jgi:transposase
VNQTQFLVGIEACASSHHWSRELQVLGHTVRLMPPAYVKPYVKRHKNDATDAEAICEAVTRPNMRFVATKMPEQQSCLTLHRTRHLFIRQQTSVINAIRAHLAEFGIVAPVGRNGVEQLLGVVADVSDKRLPEVARACVAALGTQLQTLKAQILQFDRMIMAWHRSSETSRRLDDIYPASVRCWPLLWLPASRIQRCSGQEGTSRPGLGSSPSRTRAEARTGSAISAGTSVTSP